MKVNALHNSSSAQRRARTRSLIQLGGLLEHAGTLEIFNIPLGVDLQQDESVKNNIAALFKSFLVINEMITSRELDLNILALQGLEAFKAKGLSESRPLDRKQSYQFEDYSTDELPNPFANLLDSELANDNARSSSARLASDQASSSQSLRSQSLGTHADELDQN